MKKLPQMNCSHEQWHLFAIELLSHPLVSWMRRRTRVHTGLVCAYASADGNVRMYTRIPPQADPSLAAHNPSTYSTTYTVSVPNFQESIVALRSALRRDVGMGIVSHDDASYILSQVRSIDEENVKDRRHVFDAIASYLRR